MAGQLLDTAVTERLSETLGRQGYLHLGAADFPAAVTGDDFEAFRGRWESLPADEELVDGGRYRFRRYGRLQVMLGPDGEMEMTALPPASFRQDAALIPLYAGKKRTFAPIDESVLLHPVMRGLVAFDLGLVRRLAEDVRVWVVGLHMVRIVAEPSSSGMPTPEGRHRDGHRYVGMHMLRRANCEGGRSLIYLGGGAAADVELTLVEPLDTLIVDDTSLEHEVTPIAGLEPRGIRDMLLVDLNPAAPA